MARRINYIVAAGVIFIVFLFAVIFIASAVRAARYHNLTHEVHRKSRGRHEKDDSDRRSSQSTPQKRFALEEFRELDSLRAVDPDEIINEDWLPGGGGGGTRAKAVPHRGHHSKRPNHDKTKHHLDLMSINAEKISHDTYYLGEHDHPTLKGQKIHGYAFVHYHAHSDRAKKTRDRDEEDRSKFNHFNRTNQHHYAFRDGKKKTRFQKRGGQLDEDSDIENDPWENIRCSAPIKHGARMRHSAGYFLHTDNGSKLKSRDIALAVEEGMDTWRCVFKLLNIEPLGPLLGIVDGGDEEEASIVFDKPTGENHIGFGSLTLPDGSEDQTLGITVSFGSFNDDDPDDRFLAEFKTIYNDDYHWGLCKEHPHSCIVKNAIDLPSISVHESGHAFGLDDLYSKECKHATMFWSSPPGDISKRTLEEEDLNGMLLLYS